MITDALVVNTEQACRALPMMCRANGLVLKQVKRTVAMYSVHFTADDPPHGYEVFRIRRSSGGLRLIDGKEVFFRDCERMPANEDFGFSPVARYTLLCLEQFDGRERWRFSYVGSRFDAPYCSSPVVTPTSVFFGWADGLVVILPPTNKLQGGNLFQLFRPLFSL